MHEKEGKDKFIKWFSELGKNDTNIAGGKGANLGEMSSIGMPVPPGFCITVDAYSYFLQYTELDQKIYNLLKTFDIENTKELEETSEKIKKIIEKEEMPKELEREITENYDTLSIDDNMFEKAGTEALSILKKSHEPVFVAVRSSATAEDSGEASFAGQQETFLNIKGKTKVIEAVKKCWASLFTARSIYYRTKKGFQHEKVLISVVVQKMINADKSGVIFSKNPVEKSDNVIIESVYGLGEGIVSGRISPDHYEVSRGMKIIDKRIEKKKIAITRNSSGDTTIANLTDEKSNSQVLNESEVIKLAKYSIKLEEHYKKPQDIEFAIDSGEIYIVQTRPITTLHLRQEKIETSGKEILKGQAASPGIGSGTVKIVRDLKDLQKLKKGDILVTKMTNPDMVVAMQKSAAIVTDEGGLTSHAAIISREMGIPAVVGTERATQMLKDNQEITVNGFTGKVYLGKQEKVEAEILPIARTATKIKVIVDLPDFAERAAKTQSNAVGLTRIEGIIAESGKHPLYYLKEGKLKDYEDMLVKGISKIAEYFDEVWVRTSDIRTDEFKNLQSAPKEPELNPMLGMHGIRFSLKKPEILRAELRALKRVAELKGKKIGVMTPQVISLSELNETNKILDEINFHNAKLGVMIETPAAVQIIEDLCLGGIKFISFGTNDLTQYTLAVDRGNEHAQYLYDEMHPAVLSQIASVIKTCKKHNVETSICGQSASTKPMVEFLVKRGIDSLSVNADKAGEISSFVRELESKGLRNSESGEKDMKKPKIEEIDNTERLEAELNEKADEVRQDNEKREEEWQNKEDKIEIEEKNKKEIREEFPDVDIGIDIFSQQ